AAAARVPAFGGAPESIPDWLALVGDTADGFPGIAGWGEKTAAAVLARHLPLEAIPDDPSLWGVDVRGRERLAATLREGRDDALLYRRLATLRSDVPLKEGAGGVERGGARSSNGAAPSAASSSRSATGSERPSSWSACAAGARARARGRKCYDGRPRRSHDSMKTVAALALALSALAL